MRICSPSIALSIALAMLMLACSGGKTQVKQPPEDGEKPVEDLATHTTSVGGADPETNEGPKDTGSTGESEHNNTESVGEPEAAEQTTVAIEPACGRWEKSEEKGRGDKDFPHAMAAGGVRADSAVIWTHTEAAAKVRVRYAAGPDCEALETRWVRTEAEGGFSAEIFIDGLEPDTLYRYQVEKKGGRGTTSPGWFQTPPITDRPVRFTYSADISQKDFMYGLMDDVAEQDGELYLHLGDWPYADSGVPAVTVEEFREKHLDARDNPKVKRFMRAQAIHGVWDDHEVENDWDGKTTASEPERVAAAISVWHEFFAVRDAPKDEIYRKHSWGPGLDIFYLDLRKHRSSNRAKDNRNKTMMGEAQFDWLIEELAASEATFKLVLTSVPFSFGTTYRDYWIGFKTERERLLDTIVESKVKNVVFLTADQHFMAIHHMPRGFKMFQVGAIAQTPRKPHRFVAPWVVTQHKALNFGVIDYQPGSPPTLTLTVIGNETESREDTEDPTVLYTETVMAGAGTVVAQPPRSGLYDWLVTGAHVMGGRGGQAPLEVTLAHPGKYRMEWIPLVPTLAVPEPVEKKLRDGKKITLDLDAEAQWNAPSPAFYEPFREQVEGRWQIVDQCGEDPDSEWRFEDGYVGEFGNCYDKEQSLPKKKRKKLRYIHKARRGTAMVTEAASLGPEGHMAVRIYAGDNDSFGVMWGVEGPERYYRMAFDQSDAFGRMVVNDNGEFTILAEEANFSVPTDRWFVLRISRSAGEIQVFIDETLVMTATEELGLTGGVGLYAWGMDDVRFDDLVVD